MKGFAVVTGATSGIGKEFAKKFADEGYPVLLIGRNIKKLEELKNELEEEYQPQKVETIVANLANKEDVEEASMLLEDYTIDIFVNNAGFGLCGEFLETDLNGEEEMIRVNIMALTHFTKVVLRKMVKRECGNIINMGSIASFMPNPLGSVYAATKAYVLSFSQAVNEEIRGTGVNITTLCPGPTATAFGNKSGMGDTIAFSREMSPKEVVDIGYEAMKKGKRKIVPGIGNKLLVRLSILAPVAIVLVLAKLSLKKRDNE
ncbi:MAG: SDR family oxidoreductase [Clostridioides sp.]|jgi:short-subunit dehydrogenase|nr:SDR family oxidoreductase [Clostridioides sp.]